MLHTHNVYGSVYTGKYIQYKQHIQLLLVLLLLLLSNKPHEAFTFNTQTNINTNINVNKYNKYNTYTHTYKHTPTHTPSSLTTLHSAVVPDTPSTPNPPPAPSSKIGVLFLNLGGPSTSTDVEGFLYNLFADPDIIRLPPLLSSFQKPIAAFISMRRAPKSIKAYNSIGGGSPIVKYTEEQAELVKAQLKEVREPLFCFLLLCARSARARVVVDPSIHQTFKMPFSNVANHRPCGARVRSAASSLRDPSKRHNVEVETYVGMRYWYPFTEEVRVRV